MRPTNRRQSRKGLRAHGTPRAGRQRVPQRPQRARVLPGSRVVCQAEGKWKDRAETWKGIWLFCLRTEKRDEGNVESFPFGRKSYMTNRNFYGFCHRPKLSPQDSIELFSFPRTFSKIAIIHSSFVDRLCLLGNRTTFLLQGGRRVKNRGYSGCPVTSELQE